MDTACTRYREELSAFMDGQLPTKDQSDVQTHLDGCQNCSDELGTLKQLTKFLADSMQPESFEAPDILGALMSKVPSVCDVMREDLSAYLDGELPPPAQEGVNTHLKECEPCLGDFKLLNSTNRLLTKGLELPTSITVDLWPAVKARLNEDCALIRSELSAYADQEVVNLRHRNITNHLIDCQDCRFEFNALSSVGDAIRDAYRPNIPDDFDLWPGIKSKMQVVPFAPKQTGAKTQSVQQPRWLVGVVAAAVVGIAGVVFTLSLPTAHGDTISSESFLIESALMEPSDAAETAAYEQ